MNDTYIAEVIRRESLAALLKAKETIRALHGINCRDSAEEDELWTLYQSSPEMKQINAAIDNLQKDSTIEIIGKMAYPKGYRGL